MMPEDPDPSFEDFPDSVFELFDEHFDHDTDCKRPACQSTPLKIADTPIYRVFAEGLSLCDYCGNIWDGCAQCLCYNDLIEHEFETYRNPLLGMDSNDLYDAWKTPFFNPEGLLYHEESDMVFQLYNAVLSCIKPTEWAKPDREAAIDLLKSHHFLHQKVFDLPPVKRYSALIQLIARMRKAKHLLDIKSFVEACDLSLTDLFITRSGRRNKRQRWNPNLSPWHWQI